MRAYLPLVAVVLVAACGPSKAEKKTVAVDELVIAKSVNDRLKAHPDCPTVATLSAEKELSEPSHTADPWGTPYTIACDKGGVTVTSAGPDRKAGTADDIRQTAR